VWAHLQNTSSASTVVALTEGVVSAEMDGIPDWPGEVKAELPDADEDGQQDQDKTALRPSLSQRLLSSWSPNREEKLAYLIILSTVRYQARRASLRESWLQWILNSTSKYGQLVHYGFHIVVCKDRAREASQLRLENRTHRDLFVHVSPDNTSKIVYPDKTYEFCGVEAAHRLQVTESVLNLPTKYRFITMVDDDGFLCIPSLVRDLQLFPQQNLLWGKFWCKQAIVRPDSNFLTLSSDLLGRASVHMRIWKVLPETTESIQQPRGQQPPGEHEKMSEPLPWGIALYRIIAYYIKQHGAKIHVVDDRDRLDAQQDWILTKMQDGTWDAFNDDRFKFVGRRFHRGLCRRVVWSHRVMKKMLLTRAYEAADSEEQLAALAPPDLSDDPADVCRWHSEPVDKFFVNKQCTKALGQDEDSSQQWIEELCSHRYIFIRGQHHTGTGALSRLISNEMDDVVSAFSNSNAAPDVPEYEGQFFQALWPWDNPPGPRSCFCGCESASDWVCSYLCLLRTDMSKAYSRKLLFTWRLFWNMRRPALMEKSPEMGSAHVLKMFPKVSRAIYVMRHPFSARKSYLEPACSVASVDECLDKWLTMWYKIPGADVMVVRFEDVVLREQEVRSALWVRLQSELGLPESALARVLGDGLNAEGNESSQIHGRRLELRETPNVMETIWSISPDVQRAGKSIPVDIQSFANSCLQHPECEQAMTYFTPVMGGLGYNLHSPVNSTLGSDTDDWPFVQVHDVLDSHWAETSRAKHSCGNRLKPACTGFAKTLERYANLCGR